MYVKTDLVNVVEANQWLFFDFYSYYYHIHCAYCIYC